jgi:putative redox protein
MIAKTVWKKELEFDGQSESGHSLVFDSGAAHANGPSPMEAVLMALCACTSVDVVSILHKKREPLISLTVSAVAERAPAPPSVFYKDMANLCHWWCCLKEGGGRRGQTHEE